MSKKKKNQLQPGQPLQAAGRQPVPAEPAAELPPAAPELSRESAPAVPRTYFFLFWGLIIGALALAWTLNAVMPQVPEYVIERWVMAGLATALAILLVIYK